ncbi:pentatricopeptide repeat-containing protein At1g80880, mitochondrial [Cornus florida]|uniref:pentatricopeptide repeat-containing protein At1g80880, mitochondrial n=1 Tax=Cornus florida TaxID=4283 RepID=UPI00289F08DE|nr:pentatricopeptide repeat-containing protein At1g80880, mitochondrial [Cornus florida]
MALITFASRLRRTNCQLFLPFILTSTTHPLPPHPPTSQHTQHYFTLAFHQTILVPFHSLRNSPHFSTLQASHNQSLCEPVDFVEYKPKTHQQNQSGVHELVQLLKKAKGFVSEEEAIAFLDDSRVELNTDLIQSTIWEVRDEWKLAFLVFKWGEKWGCNVEKTWGLVIWVLGNHKKFNIAWCLIRDLHRSSSMDTRAAMLIMIDSYAAANDPGKAIQTFQIMEKFRITPDLKAFYALLNTLCKHGNIEEAEEFMFLNKKLFPLEIEGFSIILNGWCNICLDVFEAKRVWREMSNCCITPNATSYTHMISCFSKVGNLFDSLRLYDEMKKRGWVPGLEVYNSLIFVLTHENCLTEALNILDKLKEAGLLPDSATYNSMIHPLCEAKKLEEARTILASMVGENVSPTIETYHAFLNGASLEETLEVLSRMRKAGLGPNKDTFLLIFSKNFELEQPENALKIWAEMKQYEVMPDCAHYTSLVEGLAMCGLLTKARELYAEMRSSGILDNPKLQMLLKEPVRGSNNERESEGQPSVVRCNKRGTQVCLGKSSSIRRKNRGKQSRNKQAGIT